MANIFFNIPVPAANGIGVAVDVSTMGAQKTIVLAGNLDGATVNLEFNNDAGALGTWAPVTTFLSGDQQVVNIAALWMRARVSGSSGGLAVQLDIGADNGGAVFQALAPPPGNGVGVAVNTSALPNFKTIMIGDPFTGMLIVEVSEDGATKWASLMAFVQPGSKSALVAAEFMRIRRVGVKGGGVPIVTIGACVPSGASVAGFGISAGSQFGTSGLIEFANSNGFTFGMSGSSRVTISGDAIRMISAGTALASGSQVVFSNSNGISFGVSGQTITASVLPVAVSGIGAISAGSTMAISGTVAFINSNNVSFGMDTNGTLTASASFSQTIQSQSTAPSAISAGTTLATSGTVVFSNSNGVSFGMDAGTVTASVSQSTGPSALSAGTTLASSGTVVFSNSNNVSFGMAAGTVTASASFSQSVQSQSTAPSAISAGTTLASSGTVVFSNSNNISFGMNAGTVTGSASFAQSTQPGPSAIAAGTQTATSGTVVFSNSNNVSFGMSGSTMITASFSQSTQPGPSALAAGTQTATSGTIVLSNSNGVSFGMAGSTQVTASVDAIKSISAGTTNITNGEVVYSNSNGVSFGASGQTITASIAASTGPSAISAGTTLASSGTVVFSNSNNVSFGMNAGTITATATASQSTSPGAFAAGTQTATSGTIVLSNSNGISFGMSGSTQITASFVAVKSAIFATGSGGTTGFATNNDTFSLLNSLGISFATNATNGRVFAPFGGGHTLSMFQDPSGFAEPGQSGTNGMLSLYRMQLPHFVNATEAHFMVSLSSINASDETYTISCGVYSINTLAGSLGLMSSGSRSFAIAGANWTASSGNQYRTVSVSFAMTPGDYVMAAYMRTTAGQGVGRFFGVHTNDVGSIEGSARVINGYSISSFSTAMPNSIAITATNYVRTGLSANAQPGFQYMAT